MKYINNITLTVTNLNTNLVLRDFIIMNLIGVGVVILSLISVWLFSLVVRQWSLRYPLFLDGYLMIKAKLKQANKIIRLSRTLSKNYDNLKYIFRNTAKAPFTTTTLRSVGSGLAVGLTVGLSPLYYGLIYEMVAALDFLTVEMPEAWVLYEDLQAGWLEQGISVSYLEATQGCIPDHSDGMCNMDEDEYLTITAELYDKSEEIESAFNKLRTLTRGINRYYNPEYISSICDDLDVQAAWARARG
jgi:hypothetical protein